ncbi:hypothetical protein PENTCL1PPCAC_28279 [Pristionchus entomophagus]|uniref:Uncharacterized protein n=1 Tax=Pristionchus entomophagus TaxID=358040 RepID=A0AAV5UJN6_9BILA|nr:hypothetical protein PENTCL1PPCAC_28279 [Pristionchus entomophagus]
MNRLQGLLFLISIAQSISTNVTSNDTMSDQSPVSPVQLPDSRCKEPASGNEKENGKCVAQACLADDSARNTIEVPYVPWRSNSTKPRFDQMLNLRIIGGACVTQQEVTEAYLKLIYIYSCIFPIIHDQRIKDLKDDTAITYGHILHLDHAMQMQGRTYLHEREERDPELIRRKIDDFIKDLAKKNDYKLYRRYPRTQEDEEEALRKKDEGYGILDREL